VRSWGGLAPADLLNRFSKVSNLCVTGPDGGCVDRFVLGVVDSGAGHDWASVRVKHPQSTVFMLIMLSRLLQSADFSDSVHVFRTRRIVHLSSP
jgi:hypothetical protein